LKGLLLGMDDISSYSQPVVILVDFVRRKLSPRSKFIKNVSAISSAL
jgi:hypothetical protein